MRTLDELIDNSDPALPLVRQWLAEAKRPCELLPPSENRGRVLVGLQVTTRSPMGAIAYESGGLLVDHGWLRILGAGHPKLPRSIVEWNVDRSSAYLLVADDVVGGFFAINGGKLGDDPGLMYYWAPDSLKWERLGIGYTDFIQWAVSDRLTAFYRDLRWEDWESEVQSVSADECFSFYPFLWTREGSVESSSRRLVPVGQQFALNIELLSKLDGQAAGQR
jgi:Protein of unknown function DUF2625